MEAIKYHDGQVVKLGDRVKIKKMIGNIEGEVTGVYDPNKPSPPRGNNDYGVNIKLANGKFLWGTPDKETVLVSRRRTSE